MADSLAISRFARMGNPLRSGSDRLVRGITRLITPEAALGLLLVFLLSACSGERHALKLSGSTMGTQYHVTVVDAGRRLDAGHLQAAIDQRLEALNQELSTYIDDSGLNHFSRSPVGEWQQISDDLYQVLLASLQVSWLSGGAFDVTIGPLVKLWGFGPGEHTDRAPSEELLEAARQRIGYQNIELDALDRRARRNADIDVDLSAIAKGYGVDVIAELVAASGATDYLVEIGGELRAAGSNPRGEPWRIAIERPVSGGAGGTMAMQPLRISGVGLATSGDYRNYFEADGVRYSHTIDPTTGQPVSHNLASVSVITDSAMWADALATAISVMGPERGYRLAEQLDIAAFLVIRRPDGEGFDIHYTPLFAQYLDNAGDSL